MVPELGMDPVIRMGSISPKLRAGKHYLVQVLSPDVLVSGCQQNTGHDHGAFRGDSNKENFLDFVRYFGQLQYLRQRVSRHHNHSHRAPGPAKSADIVDLRGGIGDEVHCS